MTTTDAPASNTTTNATTITATTITAATTKAGKKDGRTSATSFTTSKNKKLKVTVDNSTSTSKSTARKALNPSPSVLAASSSFSAAAATTTAQDNHPYARGSVIEVWHSNSGISTTSFTSSMVNSKNTMSLADDDDWWSEPDSSDDDKDIGNSKNDDGNQGTSSGGGSTKTIRLVDIIDRSLVEGKWRYYVHYRDFNRRMDEWISVDRIVSPPSVGNAKVRALKKKNKKTSPSRSNSAVGGADGATGGASSTVVDNAIKVGEGGAEGAEPTTITAPRSRRRTSWTQQPDTATATAPNETALGTSSSLSDAAASALAASELVAAAGNTGTGGGVAGATGGGITSGGGGGGRRRRSSSRRKFEIASDDATVVASNVDGSSHDDSAILQQQPPHKPQQQLQQHVKKNQMVLTDAAVTTHTVGEHVVATVRAQELDEHEGLDEASLREHEEVTKVKNVNFLELGEFQMETWYFSPLPKELLYPPGFLEVLYVCEFTFSMFARKSELRRFQSRLDPSQRHPPGNEIYRCGNLSMFEVDGLEEKIYCQNLCYIAKLFLDHKTLYFDVDPFLFYVLCEADERGFHPVGYFSKEKYSDVGYNLACILTFPAHQRKGYGRFIISFSYELTKKEEKVGSPEKPMSDLGQQAYKPYWASTLVDFLLHQSNESRLSIMDISKKTSIMCEDIVFTLNQLGILKIINGGVYLIAAEKSLLERLALRYPVKEPRVDPTKLHWTPFLTDVKRDKFSIHSKKASVEAEEKKPL